MQTRKSVVEYCLTFPKVYEDYPFHDDNWTVMRCLGNKKAFAFIYERQDRIWINIKCNPAWIDFWRTAYESIIPAYHMNKRYWNTIILDGSVLETDIKRMISESYDIVKPKSKVKRKVL
ncbi:MmcQ/YjbR family DNA-binding protein [Mobilitalea sibirica]|uniref:MmcQ/YjbR family DNA-binding protein n=1 Tax=Mobilitalea sibirica TaxID=1462919 RepID=A0A8J7H1J9_9FIRM|nr:MmcQ/YjbR family DNA-binding protein [Mobilitalea sibirica]MBH1940277.1 MmcQ/YjbR family DNA-binding protein [Mobilitalea sibirica]